MTPVVEETASSSFHFEKHIKYVQNFFLSFSEIKEIEPIARITHFAISKLPVVCVPCIKWASRLACSPALCPELLITHSYPSETLY